MIDATEGVSQLDATIAGYAHESGTLRDYRRQQVGPGGDQRPPKAMRMRNKPPGDRELYEKRLRWDLKFLNYAPIVFISAQLGKEQTRFSRCWNRSPPNGASALARRQMNQFLETVDFERASVPMRSAGEDPLYDAGFGVAADVYSLHR